MCELGSWTGGVQSGTVTVEGRRVVGHATAAITIAEFHSRNLNAESWFDLREKRQMDGGNEGGA